MSKIYLESGVYIVELEDYDGSSITNMRVAEASAPNTWYSFGSVALESPNPQWDGAYIGTHDHKFVGFGANEAPWAGNNFIIFTPTGLAAGQSITTDSLLLSGDWGSLYNQTGFVATDVKSELVYHLKGHWSFDNGDATADVGSDATVSGDMSFSSDSGRTVANLDGSGDFAVTSGNVGISGNAARTISVWAKVSSVPANDGKITPAVSWGAEGNLLMSTLGHRHYNGNHRWFFWGYNADVEGSSAVQLDTWTHIVFTHDGTTGSLYVNGSLESSGAITLNTPDSTLRIGDTVASWSNDFHGSLDDIRVYEMALNASQVSDLYNATIVTPTPETTLVGHWSFDNGDATADVGSDGTNSGATFVTVDGRTVAAFEHGDYIQIDNAGADFTTEDFTAAFWFYNDGASGDFGNLIGNLDTGSYGWGVSRYWGNDTLFTVQSGNGGSWSNPSHPTQFTIPLNTWTQVVLVRSGTEFKIYLNGVDSGYTATAHAAIAHTGDFLRIATHAYSPNETGIGKYDDVRIYSMALDASQVSDLYNATIVTPVADPTVSIVGDVSSMNLSDSVTATIELNGNSLDAPGNGYVFKWEHFDGGVWDLFQGADNAVPLSLAPSMSNKQIRAAIKVNEVYYYSDAATLPNLYPDVVIDNEAQYIQLGDTLSATVDIKGGTLEYYAWERQDSPGVWSVITGGEGSGIVNHDVTAADSGKEMQVSMRVNGEWFVASANITIPDLSGDLVPVQKNGYYPLFLTEAEANLWSAGNGSSHTHVFDSTTYYMPNGLTLGVDQFHGTYGLVLEHDCDDASADVGSSDATLTNITLTSIEGRSAWSFDSTSSRVVLDSNKPSFSANSSWTLGMWFYNLKPTGNFRTAARSAATPDIPIMIENNSTNLGAYKHNTGFIDSGFDMAHADYTGWNYIVAVGEGSNIEYYVNGSLVGTAATNHAWDLASIGNYQHSSYNQVFADAISDVRVWDRSMDADEVAYWYAETTVVDPAGPQPVTLTSTDSYGDGWNGNILTITNSDTGVEAASYTLAGGYGETVQISLDNNANYSWSFGGGMYAYESGVTVVDAGGNTLISISGGSPTSGTFSLGTPPVPPSVEFDQEATVGSVSIGDVLTATVDLQGGTLTYFAWEKYNPIAESWSSISGPTNQGVVDLTVDASMSEAIVQVSMEVDGSWYFTDTFQLPELSEAPSVTRTIRVKFGGGALAASVVIKDGNGDYVKAFIPIQISWGGANYYTADTLDVYNNYNSLVTHPQQMVNIGGGDPLYPAETPQGGGTFEFDVDMPDGNYSVQMYCGAEPDPPYIVAPTTVTIYDANSSFEDPIATLQGDGSGFDTAYYDFTIGTVSSAYDWTHGGQLTNIVKFSRGADTDGNPSYAYAKKADNGTVTLYLATDFTNFATFTSYDVSATSFVGAPVCMEYGLDGQLVLGTDAGKVYAIGVNTNSDPQGQFFEMHSMAYGETINSLKFDAINNEWIFEAGGKVHTIDNSNGTVTERYTLPAGAKIVDIASGDSGVAMIIRKADFSLEPIIATSNWSEISDEAAMGAAIVGLEVTDINYNYVMDRWAASSADGTVIFASDLLDFLS